MSYLNPSEDRSQFQRDRSFMDGLKQASNLFRSKFQPTAQGMRSAHWADDGVDQVSASWPFHIQPPLNFSYTRIECKN